MRDLLSGSSSPTITSLSTNLLDTSAKNITSLSTYIPETAWGLWFGLLQSFHYNTTKARPYPSTPNCIVKGNNSYLTLVSSSKSHRFVTLPVNCFYKNRQIYDNDTIKFIPTINELSICYYHSLFLVDFKTFMTI